MFDGDFNHLIRKTRESDITAWLRKYKSTDILFHHRFPTSTDNVKNACHPFSTKDHFETNYILIHNGHITNASSLKKAHAEIGIDYYSIQEDERFNDSEALTWDLALYLEGEQDKLQAYGGIAFICVAIKDGKKKLYFGRNSSPLFMQISKKRVFLASVAGTARNEVKRDTLYTFDYETKKLTEAPLKIMVSSWEVDYEKPKSVVIQDRVAQDADIRDDEHRASIVPEHDYPSGSLADRTFDQNRKSELETTYELYMKRSNGFFWAATKHIDKDISDWKESEMDVSTQEELYDLEDTISILQSVKDIILLHPANTKWNSKDPSFEKQLKLLEGAAA